MMHFHLVVNPAGASGKTEQYFVNKIEPLFKDVSYSVHRSTKEHGIRSICRELTDTAEEINLIICGGDGSMFDAVNGIRDFSKTNIGMIPCGSGNDLAKDLNMPSSLEDLVAVMKQGVRQRTMDLGEVIFHSRYEQMDHDRYEIHPVENAEPLSQYFNVSSGMGFDAKTCQQVFLSGAKQTLNRLHLGKLVYLWVAVRLVFENESFSCKIQTEDDTFTVNQCMFAVGMNHRFEGGGFMFGPGAKDQDGLLENCIIQNITPSVFFRLFPSAYSGKHVKYKDKVRILSSKEMHIQSNKPMWVHTDGEVYYTSDSITIKIHENLLNLLF